MLSAFLGITDNKWFEYLQWNKITDEVNFWIPSAPPRKLIEPGTLWLLKLHRMHLPDGTIVDPIAGVGVFMHYSVLPLQVAWVKVGEELQTEAFLSIDSRPPGRLSISIGRVYRKSD